MLPPGGRGPQEKLQIRCRNLLQSHRFRPLNTSRMASQTSLEAAAVRRPRAGDRARSTHLTRRQSQPVTSRPERARLPPHRRRLAGPGLHPTRQPSRHPDPQHRARPAARRPLLHRLRPSYRPPTKGLRPHRHRSPACPVTENPDQTTTISDQSPTPIENIKFRLNHGRSQS